MNKTFAIRTTLAPSLQQVSDEMHGDLWHEVFKILREDAKILIIDALFWEKDLE